MKQFIKHFIKQFIKSGTLILAIVLCCLSAAPALAAGLPIILDGVNVSLEPNPFYAANNIPPSYAYERLAQEQGGTAYVPLRFIAETFNTQVDYSKGRITLTSGDRRLELTIGSTAACQNGQPLTLPAAPYVKNAATFVPLRFVAENFGCVVYYHDGVISIATEPFTIDGNPVASLELEDPWHVVGSDFYQIKGAHLQRNIYNALQAVKGSQAPAPEAICRSWMAEYDDYFWSYSFTFKDAGGQTLCDLQIIRQCYKPAPGAEENFPNRPALLYDHLTDTYYTIPQALWQQAEPLLERNLQFREFTGSDAP